MTHEWYSLGEPGSDPKHPLAGTWQHESAKCDITALPGGGYYLAGLVSEQEHQGHATALVERISRLADLESVPLNLAATSPLLGFYARLGFQPTLEHSGMTVMVRRPGAGRPGGPAFMHADRSCPVCFPKALAPWMGAVPAEPLRNPTGNLHWYHGTSFSPEDEEGEHEAEHRGHPHAGPDPGGYLHPQETHFDADDDTKHWNTDLGTHFTSLPHVAQDFANSRKGNGGGHPVHNSRVAHTFLHMSNPKHYASEDEMAHHAITLAHDKGLTYMHPSASKEERASFMRGDHAEDEDDDHRLSRARKDLSHAGRTAAMRIDQHGPGDSTLESMDGYLSHHPDRQEILHHFSNHLAEQGHDGITYGNSYEGPKGHACAIALHPHQVNVRKWQWLHDSQQHLNQPGAQESHDDFSSQRSIHDYVRPDGSTKSAHVISDFDPTERLFAPTKETLDPRLFGADRTMLPKVRSVLVQKMDDFMGKHGGPHWTTWARMYLAGSEASLWWGNNDFDILVGIDYDGFRKATNSPMRDEEITDAFNRAFRIDWNDEQWHPSFDDDEWHLTGYVNQGSWDIRKIKPYAAYEIVSDSWFVEPISEPTGHKFDQSLWYYMEGFAERIRAAMELREPSRRNALNRIWMFLHKDRARAFGPNGTGAFDRGNATEKFLDQAGLWDPLVKARFTKVASESDDDWRMSHRPPGPDGTPMHDMTHNFPADVYTHPHYYSDMSEPSVREAHHQINRVRGNPDAKVRVYRSMPAEHIHKGFQPGDWVSLSKDYAQQHGVHHSDPAHDWPVIRTTVRAGDLHTDGDDFREFGYNGSDNKQGMVSYKGGFHQEVRQHADGVVRPVRRRTAAVSLLCGACGANYFTDDMKNPHHEGCPAKVSYNEDRVEHQNPNPLLGHFLDGTFAESFTADGFDHDAPREEALERHGMLPPPLHVGASLLDVPAPSRHDQPGSTYEEFIHNVRQADPEGTQGKSDHETKQHWDSAIRHGIGVGDLSIGQAEKKGFRGDGNEHGRTPEDWSPSTGSEEPRRGGYKPLPHDLHHVTTDTPGVLHGGGLKTRREQGTFSGKGLGGGSDDHISVTSDKGLAHSIYHSLHEYHAFLNGKINHDDLVTKHAGGADKIGLRNSLDRMTLPEHREQAARGMTSGGSPGPFLTQQQVDQHRPGEGWRPHPDSTPSESGQHSKWERPMNDDEKVQKKSEHYKHFSWLRDSNGGHRDPLFMSNDPVAFAKSDPSKFSLLHLHPSNPRAQGYPLSRDGQHHDSADSGEWRVPTGDALKVHGFSQPTPRHEIEQGGQEQRTAVKVYGGAESQRYFHGTTRRGLTHVLPGTSHGQGTYYGGTNDPSHAYATDTEDNAWHYAELAYNHSDRGRPRVYEVEPHHPHDVHPDPTHDESGRSRGNFSGDVRSPSGFHVVREVPPPEHFAEGYDTEDEDDRVKHLAAFGDPRVKDYEGDYDDDLPSGIELRGSGVSHHLLPTHPLCATQHEIDEHTVNGYRTGQLPRDKPPILYRDEHDNDHIIDGHHRLMADRREGKTTLVQHFTHKDRIDYNSPEAQQKIEHNKQQMTEGGSWQKVNDAYEQWNQQRTAAQVYGGALDWMNPSVGQQPEREDAPDESGHHTYYRGITMSGKGSEGVDWDDDESVLNHLSARNTRYTSKFERGHPKRTAFGKCWTTGHNLAHKFAMNTFSNMGRRQAPVDRSQPHYGAVLEAKTTQPCEEESHLKGYNEQERKVETNKVHSLTLHLHRLDPEHTRGASPEQTHVRSIEVPASRYQPTNDEKIAYHKESAAFYKNDVPDPEKHEFHKGEVKRLKAEGSTQGHDGWLPHLDPETEQVIATAAQVYGGRPKPKPRPLQMPEHPFTPHPDDPAQCVDCNNPEVNRHHQDVPGWQPRLPAPLARVHYPEEGPDGEASDGIMIALVPPKRVINALPLPEDGEHPSNIHITLLYLGKVKDFTKEQVEYLPELVESWGETQKPLMATVQGVGTFSNPGSHVLWAAADIPGGNHMWVSLADTLRSHGYKFAENHGWTPHLTMSYEKHHVRFLPKIERMEFRVREVWVCVGGRWESYPLKG